MGGGGSKGYSQDDAVVNSLYKIIEGEDFITSNGRKIEIEEVLEVCKDLGVDVNSVNDKGETVLIFAAKKNNERAVVGLMNFGADNSIIDKSGKTAFEYACEKDNAKIAACLIYKDYKSGDHAKWFSKVEGNEGFAKRLSDEIALLENKV